MIFRLEEKRVSNKKLCIPRESRGVAARVAMFQHFIKLNTSISRAQAFNSAPDPAPVPPLAVKGSLRF
jgi:hypothetical protein